MWYTLDKEGYGEHGFFIPGGLTKLGERLLSLIDEALVGCGPKLLNVIFRDTNQTLALAVKNKFPNWDVATGDIFSAKAPLLFSPANTIGRMDGGIDQVFINRFGWQLEARLMRDIKKLYDGQLPIGKAHFITTYDTCYEGLICAPTMSWPPGDITGTDNVYKSLLAAFKCAHQSSEVLCQDNSVLMSGFGTLTGNVSVSDYVAQAKRAWEEYVQWAST
jgi:O-acetyl-ADP-ribose deacetylase (regulator of RNase III)